MLIPTFFIATDPWLTALGQAILLVAYLFESWAKSRRDRIAKEEAIESERRIKEEFNKKAEEVKSSMRTRVSDLSKRLDQVFEESGSIIYDRRKEDGRE